MLQRDPKGSRGLLFIFHHCSRVFAVKLQWCTPQKKTNECPLKTVVERCDKPSKLLNQIFKRRTGRPAKSRPQAPSPWGKGSGKETPTPDAGRMMSRSYSTLTIYLLQAAKNLSANDLQVLFAHAGGWSGDGLLETHVATTLQLPGRAGGLVAASVELRLHTSMPFCPFKGV